VTVTVQYTVNKKETLKILAET